MSYLDIIDKDFMNDKLIPDDESETLTFIIQVLQDYIYQTS